MASKILYNNIATKICKLFKEKKIAAMVKEREDHKSRCSERVVRGREKMNKWVNGKKCKRFYRFNWSYSLIYMTIQIISIKFNHIYWYNNIQLDDNIKIFIQSIYLNSNFILLQSSPCGDNLTFPTTCFQTMILSKMQIDKIRCITHLYLTTLTKCG